MVRGGVVVRGLVEGGRVPVYAPVHVVHKVKKQNWVSEVWGDFIHVDGVCFTVDRSIGRCIRCLRLPAIGEDLLHLTGSAYRDMNGPRVKVPISSCDPTCV